MVQNNVDIQYLNLLRDIIDNGVWKNTRSGRVKSVFGRTMRFNLKEGFPLLTTKKVYTKGIVHELLWFLSGNTNIRYLVDNNVHIWDDDAFRWFKTLDFKHLEREESYYDDEDQKMHIDVHGYYKLDYHIFDLDEDIENAYAIVLNDDIQNEITVTVEFLKNITKEQFIEYVKQNAWIHCYDIYQGRSVSDRKIYQFGDLGEIYGKQWRDYGVSGKDQIQNIIDTLKTNPDDRRMVLSAWNPDVIDDIALPACHMFATFWTRELTYKERFNILLEKKDKNNLAVIDKLSKILDIVKSTTLYHILDVYKTDNGNDDEYLKSVIISLKNNFDKLFKEENVPSRELSCSFTMRSNDCFLGASFNIASYALLTHLIAQCCNMTVGELVYNGLDIHIYENHITAVNEQLSRYPFKYNLPTLSLNEKITDINDFKFEDIKILNYESYPVIKAPLNVG